MAAASPETAASLPAATARHEGGEPLGANRQCRFTFVTDAQPAQPLDEVDRLLDGIDDHRFFA